MVGVVVVAHSEDLARGAREVARQMGGPCRSSRPGAPMTAG